MHVGAEVAQADERLAAGVFDFDAAARPLRAVMNTSSSVLAPKRIITGVWMSSRPMRPRPCTVIQPLAPGSLQRALGARLERQLLGAEELLAVDRAVDDPAVGVALAAALLGRRSAPGSCAP